jgi:hypothetical protein
MKKERVIVVAIAISCTFVQFLEKSVHSALVDIKVDLVDLHDFTRTAGVVVVEAIVEEIIEEMMVVAEGTMTVGVVVVAMMTIETVDVVDTMIEEVEIEIEVEIEMIRLKGELE